MSMLHIFPENFLHIDFLLSAPAFYLMCGHIARVISVIYQTLWQIKHITGNNGFAKVKVRKTESK